MVGRVSESRSGRSGTVTQRGVESQHPSAAPPCRRSGVNSISRAGRLRLFRVYRTEPRTAGWAAGITGCGRARPLGRPGTGIRPDLAAGSTRIHRVKSAKGHPIRSDEIARKPRIIVDSGVRAVGTTGNGSRGSAQASASDRRYVSWDSTELRAAGHRLSSTSAYTLRTTSMASAAGPSSSSAERTCASRSCRWEM